MFIRAVTSYIILLLSLVTITCVDDIATNSTSKIHTWERTYGIGDTDVALSVIQTSDGAFVAAGYTLTYEGGGYPDVYLFMVDSLGDLIWERNFGGEELMTASSLIQDSDGGILIVGNAASDVLLLKTDPSGNLLWQKTFGRGDYNAGRYIAKTSDGGFIIVGETRSSGSADAYMIKLDAHCNLEWQNIYGATGFDFGMSVVQTIDGGYILVGDTDSYVGGIFIVGVDANGGLKWQKAIGGKYDAGYSIVQSGDGNYVIGGVSFAQLTSDPDFLLVKIDSSANIIWQNTFGGPNVDYLISMIRSYDGGYVMAGLTNSFGAGEYDVFMVKANSYGNLVWQKTYGDVNDERARCISQTSDGGYILAGDKDQAETWLEYAYLIKTDVNGDL
jgi:hypothetical protein